MVENKTVIITGSGRGIGKETAILLAIKGLNVVICSRTQNEINLVVNRINEVHHNNDNILGIKCDVSISSEVDSLVKAVIEKFDGIDILVNNAGLVFVKKLVNTSEEEWDQTINTNLKGIFLCTKAVLPHMIGNKERGVIINVSSGAGKTGFENLSAYCASKFGIIGLTESLAWEVASHSQMRVMTLCPGEVATKMQKYVDYRQYENRMLKPIEVAEKIVDMIFDNARYRNGQSVDIG
jgi:3-oxoacyl-[acyl-carrier protein] reductase